MSPVYVYMNTDSETIWEGEYYDGSAAMIDAINRGADLTGADCTSLSLPGIKPLIPPTFGNSGNFTDCDFAGADLTGANFSRCNLTRTNFTGAILTGATLHMSLLNGTNFTNAVLNNAVLTGCSIVGATFYQAQVNGLDLSSTAANSCTFYSAWGAGINLTDANVQNCNFSYTSLNGAALTRTNFSGSLLRGVNIWNNPPTFSTASIANVDFSSSWLSSCTFRNVNFVGCNLNYANMSGCDLYASNLQSVSPSNMNRMDWTKATWNASPNLTTSMSAFNNSITLWATSLNLNSLANVNSFVNPKLQQIAYALRLIPTPIQTW